MASSNAIAFVKGVNVNACSYAFDSSDSTDSCSRDSCSLNYSCWHMAAEGIAGNDVDLPYLQANSNLGCLA